MNRIFNEIQDERKRQDAKWGGPAHDDQNNNHDWITYLNKHIWRTVVCPWNRGVFRRQMVIVAALAIAAIEWADRLNEKQGETD